jgi:hypothetical protein
MQGIHRKERENKKRKTLLTHTGLLMEGVTEVRWLGFAVRFAISFTWNVNYIC